MKNIDFKILFNALDNVGIRAKSVLHYGSNEIMDFKVLHEVLDKKGVNHRPKNVQSFYESLGFEDISLVNIEELADSPNKQYELVVNPGSSAMLFDQRYVFDLMNERTVGNGFQLHVVPFLCTLDNHMFAYMPNFFHYIAKNQKHEILKAYFCNYACTRCLETIIYNDFSGFKYEKEFGMNFLQNENWTSHIGLGVVYKKQVPDVQEDD